MKKLFLLIIPFLFVTSVKAITFESYQSSFKVADSSCTNNLFYPALVSNASFRTSRSTYFSLQNNSASYLIPVDSSTRYYLRSTGTDLSGYWTYCEFTSSTIAPFNCGSSNSSFLTSGSTTFIGITFTSSQTSSFNDSTAFMLTSDSTLPFESYSTSCGGGSSLAGETYSSFVNLYIDRITYLASGFTTNPYLLTMLGIIFSFVVLELFLKILHLKGGYRK